MPFSNISKKLLKLDQREFKDQKEEKKIKIRRILIGILVFVIFIVLPVRGVYVSARSAMSNARLLMAATKQDNLDLMKEGAKGTSASVSGLNRSLNFMIWMSAVPFLGGYYNDARHLVKAADYELKALEKTLEILDPYKNELGLIGNPTPGQDKIAQAVKVLDKVIPNLDKIEPDLKKAREEVEKINTGKYPQKIGSKEAKKNVEFAKGSIIGIHEIIANNSDLVRMLPEALGSYSPKTYLLIFQNDKELRATGGFMTAYAFLTIDKGHLSTSASDDIYRLDERLLKVCLSVICPLTPPAPIVKYLPEFDGKPRKAWSLRDSNLSPDFATSIADFENMYKFLGDGLNFDGIIAIDTKVVEELIKITGPIDVFGTKYTAETDARCNCPNVIYELEHYAQIASKGEEDRKAVLGTLMQQILARALGIGPDKMPTLLTTGIQLANEKHVLFNMHNSGLQQGLSKLNWVGEIKKVEGDYLHINDSNFAGGKSNLYVTEKVTYDIKIDKDGSVRNKIFIEYKNPQPFNTWLNGILRDYIRIYVPSGSKLVSSKGSEDPPQTKDDTVLGKTYFEAFLTVRPQNSRVMEIEYALPNKVSGKNYKLLIQKQPGTKDHHYIVKVNGQTKAEFDLTSDKELNLGI